jgi:hypothetical protein
VRAAREGGRERKFGGIGRGKDKEREMGERKEREGEGKKGGREEGRRSTWMHVCG